MPKGKPENSRDDSPAYMYMYFRNEHNRDIVLHVGYPEGKLQGSVAVPGRQAQCSAYIDIPAQKHDRSPSGFRQKLTRVPMDPFRDLTAEEPVGTLPHAVRVKTGD
ncbi:hypothetical protein Bbelb_054320 [Branchiostoma belcheri]|nr:hypothetical protein Bbelb_054320 [Branchiostoma belcheri]